MSVDPKIVERLVADVRDLRVQNAALLALISAIPEASEIDIETARAALEKVIDGDRDIIAGDQIARAMHFMQLVTRLAHQREHP